MIKGAHSVIRTADPDDAEALKSVYDSQTPRSSLLDQRRELIAPTRDELREVMSQKEMGKAVFYTVEDVGGEICGFCCLRGSNPEAQFSEFVVIFLEESTFSTPMADEVFDFLSRLAFERMRNQKVVTHCLDSEAEYRKFLISHGFRSAGVQRDVLYSQGRWFNLEALTLRARDVAFSAGGVR
ncbi:MAG: GNAT family N-acetyltransferase [Candidatus Hydrogenedentes bacterium]|nr:GNAT family N-acetyltransferase [Candidatus Hydrogenedentota bacterium]